jgi:hypothetical protein
MTRYYEPIRPIHAPDNGAAYAAKEILGNAWRVFYGSIEWPSRSLWIVPGTER